LQWRAGPIVYSAACADNSNEYSTRRHTLRVGFAWKAAKQWWKRNAMHEKRKVSDV